MSTPPPLPGQTFISAAAPMAEPVAYQTAPASGDVAVKPKPSACVSCGAAEFSTRTQMPLCEHCRMTLVKFPFPLWVRLAAAVVVVLVLVSLVLSRGRLLDAYHYARAQKMAGQEHWEEAYQSYHSLSGAHSDTETLLNYAETALKSGHRADAAQAVSSLRGRYVQDYQKHRAEVVVDELERGLRQEEQQVAVPAKAMIPRRPN